MGGANVPDDIYDLAFDLGERIAQNGWLLLNGGRDAGVMRASAHGAKKQGGTTIGILPGETSSQANPFIDIPIVTNLSDARNMINVLSSDVVVACPGSAGTISEIALALKNKKNVVLLKFDLLSVFEEYVKEGLLYSAETVDDCINLIKFLLDRSPEI
jgi:uncharacterized protein (TIGR00725 family)